MDGVADRPMEVELKYRMSGAAPGERLLASDELAGLHAHGPAVDVLQEDRYLDTIDAALARAGYAARLRSTDQGTIISLKGLRRQDDGGAIHRRAELEGPADAAPPVAWPASEARDMVVSIAGDRPLFELVVLRQLRRKRWYGPDDAVVELSLDEVEVVSGGRVIDRFAELEAEIRQGDESVLAPLAELFAGIEELVPASTSKLERAMEAVRRELPVDGSRDAGRGAQDDSTVEGDLDAGFDGPDDIVQDDTLADDTLETSVDDRDGDPFAPRPEEDLALVVALEGAAHAAVPDVPEATNVPSARPDDPQRSVTPEPAARDAPRITAGKTPGVQTDDHLAEAGRKVLRFHLARMVAREPGTREGNDNEELHGMRVATRRQRAAWRVFGGAFDQKRTARHPRRLKAVARHLGAVRDLDVLIQAGEGYQKKLPSDERPSFEPLLAKWRAQREAARVVLIKELDSDRYQRWVDEYIAFVQAEGIGTRSVGPVEPHRVRDTMPSRIWGAYEGVRAYEPVMRWADVTTLHDLRIAAKWLRYTIEFVREALGPESAPVIERVVALQDHLGELHDADVAAGLARGFLVEHAGDLSEEESAAIGRYLVDRERELARLRRTVGPAWRGVSGLAFRRALGRLVAGL
jgi:CHAD domain-containing protein